MDAKTPKAEGIAGAWLVVAVSHDHKARADFVTSIRCNGQWAAEDVAEFIRQRPTIGAHVFFDPCEPTTTAPERAKEEA
jgi:hypothetical protein